MANKCEGYTLFYVGSNDYIEHKYFDTLKELEKEAANLVEDFDVEFDLPLDNIVFIAKGKIKPMTARFKKYLEVEEE